MKQYQRRSIRLKGFDYSNGGYYFVTVCSFKRKNVWGKISGGKFLINDWGKILVNNWLKLSKKFSVDLDVFQLMPNHFHAIIVIKKGRGLINQTQKMNFDSWMGMMNHAPTLGHVIRYFKAITSREIGMQLWQRNFFERIIRNEKELEAIRDYIRQNPKNWESDSENVG